MDDNLDLPGEYEDYRENLLNDFARKLKDDPKTILYDEDEWIELADYALDVENYFLFMEAVIWGLSAFPGSIELRDREAILASEFVQDRRDAFNILASRPKASRIARMLKFEANQESLIPPSFYNGFKKAVLDGNKLADHEVIEAVRILTDADCLDMLTEQLELWEKNVQYTQTLWYEIAASALDTNDPVTGLEVIDKLLAEHPYNPDYWLINAKLLIQYLSIEDLCPVDEIRETQSSALEAIDNVLAIRPDDTEAKQLKLFFNADNSSDNEASVEFNDSTINLFRLAVDSINNDSVKTLSKIIPQSWFNEHMDLSIYLSLDNVNDDHSMNIINGWIKWTLNEIYDPADFRTKTEIEKTALYSICETFSLYHDSESITDLYNRVEAISTQIKYPNPLDFEYALMCLRSDKTKEFNKVYSRLSKNKIYCDINFALLTFFNDLKSGKKDLVNDSLWSLSKLFSANLSDIITSKGYIKLADVHPSAVKYLCDKLTKSLFDKL